MEKNGNRKYTKRFLIIFLVLIEVFSLFLAYKSLNNKEVILDEVNILKKNNSMFAMYKENDNGEYEEITDTNTFPQDYKLNETLTGCTDINGNSIEVPITYSNGKVTVTSNKTVYCYLYFDIVRNLVKQLLKNNLLTEYTGPGYYHDENNHDTENPYFTRPIYYWNGTESNVTQILNKWNVVFAGSCWKIIRTTEAGGMKLLYNGEPTTNIDDKGKIIYDCSTNRMYKNAGIGERNIVDFNGEYYYSDSYNWDRSSGKFSLVSPSPTGIILSSVNSNDLIGKYTCKGTTADATCDTLYYIDEYISGTNAYTIILKNIDSQESMGKSKFNNSTSSLAYVGYMYNGEENVQSSGNKFLYNSSDTNILASSSVTLLTIRSVTGTHYYADTYVYGNTDPDNPAYCATCYTIKGQGGDTANNLKTASGTSDWTSLIGKYTLLSNSETYGTTSSTKREYIYYVFYADSSYIYCITLQNNTNKDTLLNEERILYDNYVDNNDGTYTLSGENRVKTSDWPTNYATYSGKYMCSDNNTICNYENTSVISTSITGYTKYSSSKSKLTIYQNYTINDDWTFTLDTPVTIDRFAWYNGDRNYNGYYQCADNSSTCTYADVKKITSSAVASFTSYVATIAGQDVTYDEATNKYTINIKSNNAKLFTKLPSSNVNDAHYTCFSTSNECSIIYYVYYIDNSNPVYVTLTNGKYVETDTTNIEKFNNEKNILYQMLYSPNVNSKDSTIKTNIDNWYKIKFLGKKYEEMIDFSEVFCGDRSTSNNFGNWNSNASNMSTGLVFGGLGNSNLSCPNVTDAYSAPNDNRHIGNEDLTYPIALMSYPEINLLYDGLRSNNDQLIWLMSPLKQSYSYGYNIQNTSMYYGGSLKDMNVTKDFKFKPSIALKQNVEYTQGDGSVTNPYVVSLGMYNIETNDDNYKIAEEAFEGHKIIIRSNDNIIKSFKLNGKKILGNSFFMPNEDVSISDIESINININDNDIKFVQDGSTIKLIQDEWTINEFKLNGELINSNIFTIPNENVEITDVEKIHEITIETETHNPFPMIYGIRTYYEHYFENATSITIELTYQTHTSDPNSTGVRIYQLNDNTIFGTYGNQTQTTEILTIPSNYIKIEWFFNLYNNNWAALGSKYGFKAIITPNYD